MTRARTLADMISDGVIGTTELADDAITPVKLDETGSYAMAGLTVDTNTLHVDSANNRIGVGTTSPAQIMHIYGATPQIYLETSDSRGEAWSMRSTNGANNNTGTLSFRDEAGNNWLDLAQNVGSPRTRFYNGQNSERLTVTPTELVVNESSTDYDFRVESNSYGHALFVDAADNTVNINRSASGDGLLNIKRNTSGNSIFLYNSNNNYPTSSTGNSDITAGFYDYLTGGDYAGGTARLRFESASAYVGNRAARITLRASPNDGTNVDREMARFHPDEIAFNDLSYNQDFRVESDANSNMLHINAGDSHVNIGSSTAHGVLGVQQGASAGVNATTLGLNHVHANNKYIDFKWYNNSIMNIAQEGGSNIGINWNNTLAFNSSESGSSDFRIASDTISHLFAIDASENRVSIGGTSFSEGSGFRFNVKGGASRFINSAADVQMRIEGGGYTDPHRARLTLTGGYGDTGRLRFWHIDGQAHGGGGNVYNDLRFGYEVTNSATLYEVMRFDANGHVIVNENGASNVDFRVESGGKSHMLFVDADQNTVGINTTEVGATLNIENNTGSAQGYPLNIKYAKAIRTHTTPGRSDGVTRQIRITVEGMNYNPIHVKVSVGGIYYNNGAATYSDMREVTVIKENANLFRNTTRTIHQYSSKVNSFSVSGANNTEFKIDIEVQAGYNIETYVEAYGVGVTRISNIQIIQ